MRVFAFWSSAILAVSLTLAAPSVTLADDLIPAKRLAISENTDLPGGDFRTHAGLLGHAAGQAGG